MQIAHIDHLNLSVADLDASVDWYGRVFGFQAVEQGEYAGSPWKILRSGEALLCLYEHPERRLLDSDALGGEGVHGLSHFGLRVRDPEAWEETVSREGLEVLYGGVVQWPASRSWYVLDPTGYEIEVGCWNGDRVEFGGRRANVAG